MTIGIDASRAFGKQRTGIENYSFHVIRALRGPLGSDRVVLYTRDGAHIPFSLPESWEVRTITWPILWTQGGLAWEMWRRPVNTLFVPAHTPPWIHPKKSVVVVHGLEYERIPEAYFFLNRWVHRTGTKLSCRWAGRIISVSESTKRDLVEFYGIDEEKIVMIYEGRPQIMDKRKWIVGKETQLASSPPQLRGSGESASRGGAELRGKCLEDRKGVNTSYVMPHTPYFLFIGRLEARKNIVRMIEAFERFKEKSGASHQLVLAGSPGYGYKHIEYQIEKSKYREYIREMGYVREDEKWKLFRNADALVFVSLAEGFGLPILEAQAVGTPVITSNIPALLEVAGEGAICVDPKDEGEIVRALVRITDHETQNTKSKNVVELGRENVRRFSWEKTAREIAQVLREI